MKDNFARSLKPVLVHEGGYVNHPKDPGGATNKGVTQATYDGYRARKGLPKRSVRNLEERELQEIYYEQYWLKVRGDDLPVGVDFTVFDGAVNSGPSRQVRWLQAALGVKRDGMLGEATLAAVNAHPNHDALIAEIIKRRLAFLKRLRTWPTFGRGWSKRLAGVLKTGQAWASGNVGPKIVHVPGMGERAISQDLKRPSRARESIADASIAGGSVTTTISGAVQQLEPVKESSPVLMQIFIALTVAGIAIAAIGVALRWYNNRQAERTREADASEAEADLDDLDAHEFEPDWEQAA